MVKLELMNRAFPETEVRSLAQCDDEVVSGHVRDVLDEWDRSDREDEFDLYCRFFCDSSEVETGLWMLAALLDRDADTGGCLKLIDQWGNDIATQCFSGCGCSTERVKCLARYMSERLGFEGNAEDYYNPSNSLLTSVIRTRRGLPISLTMLYRLVGLRAGMIVDGINFPGHFLARHEGVYFDPFHSGRILTRKDCESLLAKQGLKFDAQYLEPAHSRQILVRTLANLRHVYFMQARHEPMQQVTGWLSILCGAV